MKPLLTLCMIVKDEAHGIARTLRSVKPWIDRWCILDTGSTDDTVSVVLRETDKGDGLGSFVDRVPFVDFATTRNELLARGANSGSDFLLLLDADDILEGGEALRAFLQAEPGEPEEHEQYCDGWACAKCSGAWRDPQREAFYLRVQQGDCAWSSARVVRAEAVGVPCAPRDVGPGRWHNCKEPCGATGCLGFARQVVQDARDVAGGWHYVGAVHEVLVKPGAPTPSITIPGVTIRHEPAAVSVEKSRARWERDAKLLAAELERGPDDARASFYLAKTYKQLGNLPEARTWFRRRIVLGGWREEVFESLLDLARCEGEEERHVLGFLAAAAFAPHRAEPLVDLAAHYRATEQHALAFLFAARAAQLPYPAGDSLFVDAGVYAWRAHALVSISAWYIGEWEAGEAATRKALAGDPPAEWRTALEDNLRLYEERKR